MRHVREMTLHVPAACKSALPSTGLWFARREDSTHPRLFFGVPDYTLRDHAYCTVYELIFAVPITHKFDAGSDFDGSLCNLFGPLCSWRREKASQCALKVVLVRVMAKLGAACLRRR